MPWLRLIRWKNLLIIFITQFLAWFCVIVPLHPEVLSLFNFLLLSLSTLLIAASGYIINDYFDIKIDSINRPEKMVLGKTIAMRTAIIIHSLFNIIALLISGFIAMQEHSFFLPMVQLFCTVLLWFYSTKFKREYMIGNIVVSLLTSLTIITLILYEPVLLRLQQLPFFIETDGQSSLPFWVLLVYAWFAFMLNWIREIVKDMEDFIGDQKEGCQTMPIKKGLKYSANFAIGLAFIVIAVLLLASWLLIRHRYLLFAGYVFLVLIVPIVRWCILLNQSTATKDFKKLSRNLKIIMVLGILSLIIYYL